MRPPILGTPSLHIEQIQRYVDVGVTLLIVRFLGESFEKEVGLFAEEVMLAFM